MNLSTLFSAYVKARLRMELAREDYYKTHPDGLLVNRTNPIAKLYQRRGRLAGKLEQRILYTLQVRETQLSRSKGKSKCQLIEHPEFGGCCCQCKFRLRALEHKYFPSEMPLGWVCIAFAFLEGEDVAYVGDFEHGMCELFTPRTATVAEGDISSCKLCDRPIEYFGPGWRHTTCCPVHLAIPAEESND